jgi:hypothetical protein
MADAPANVTKIGYLDFPLRSWAGETNYAKIGSDGQGNYYEWSLIDSDLGTFDWTLITDDDDIERIRGGSLQASPESTAPSVPAPDSSTPNSFNTALLTPAVAPAGTGSLRYPDNVSTKGDSHYVLFNFKKYKPPFSAAANQAAANQSNNAYNAYNANTNNLEASDLAQVLLYMPEGVAASYKANWDGKAFGNVAAGILRTAGSAMDGDYANAIRSLQRTAGKSLDRMPEYLASKAITSLTKKLTGDSIGIQDVFSSIGGAILNPNVELIFGGHDLRTLQLTFKMVPYNKTEAIAVDNIVTTFKKAMLPTLNAGDSGDFWGALGGSSSTKPANTYGTGYIGVPNLVQVTFMKGGRENDRVAKYKVCSITDFDVNYSPDGVYAIGPDGYPVATEIRVNLMETKLVYKEDVAYGY